MGAVYTPAEIKALTTVAHKAGMKVHMDGARFANALVSLNCTPAEMTWRFGIDVLSFGGTKNGAMILESVVFFDEDLAEDFLYRRKRAGQLLSKGRFLSAQMLAYLKDGLWLENARRANGAGHGSRHGLHLGQMACGWPHPRKPMKCSRSCRAACLTLSKKRV